MSTSITFFSLVSALIEQANEGVRQAVEACKDEPVVFTAPQIEIELKGTVTQNNGVKFTPSNAQVSSYYGEDGESIVKIKLKQIPK